MDRNGYNASLLDTVPGECFLCGRVGDCARHEVFYGPNRKKSKEMGMWIYACPNCHQFASYAVHRNPNDGLDLKLKKTAQAKFEAVHGHDKFMEIFGKNYL